MAAAKKRSGKGKKSVSQVPDLAGVRKKVEQHYPYLWPAVEAGLSVCATLLLKDNANPTALIYIGPASAGKTTVASMFDGSLQEGAKQEGSGIVYRSDQFTPASFVTQAATVLREELEKIDLLPRIKHKVLLTPDLVTMFRGKADELTERFSIITRVLDGQGLTRDGGAHGQRGYTGDYLFAWLGCTTPLTDTIWGLMAQLGSRLFFFSLDSASEPTEEDLVQSITKDISYQPMLKECQHCVQDFLKTLFLKSGGVKSVIWVQRKTPVKVARTIAALASMLAKMRTRVQDSQHGETKPESAHRAMAVLHNVARGHAIINGRTRLTEEDLPVVAGIVLSSMPLERRAVLQAFAQHDGNDLSVNDVSKAVGISQTTAREVMREISRLKIAHFDEKGSGKPSALVLNPAWRTSEKGEMWKLVKKVTTSQKNGDVLAEDQEKVS